MRTKNANEKKCAKLAKTLVMDAIYEKIVTLENIDYDKYGRVLADVMTEDGRHVNDLLLKENLAVEYIAEEKSRRLTTGWNIMSLVQSKTHLTIFLTFLVPRPCFFLPFSAIL